MGIKSLIKYGAHNDNILIRIYFIGSLGWLGLLLLIEFLFLLGGRQEIYMGGLSIGELLYVLLVLTIIGLIPLIPFSLLCIKKQYSGKLEVVEEKPEPSKERSEKKKEEKPAEKPKEEKKKSEQTDEEPTSEEDSKQSS
jgi:hypothetical protein